MIADMSVWSDRFKPWKLSARPGETESELEERRALSYFEWQFGSVQEFWTRLGEEPNVAGKRVLDLGCGHGTMSVDLAMRGAQNVTGLDLDRKRIAFAARHARVTYPSLAERISFRCEDVMSLSAANDRTFDLIVSKDTFEHIERLEPVIGSLWRLLKPGGRLMVGAGPLYFSPFGDHGRFFGSRVPWTTVIPEPVLFRLASVRLKRHVNDSNDLGLNKLTPHRFRGLFGSEKWTILKLTYNAGSKKFFPVFRQLRKVPFLERFFTVNLYASILRL